MKEKKDKNVEQLAEELESRLVREDELEEIALEDDGEEWLSEEEIPEKRRKSNISEKKVPEKDWEDEEFEEPEPMKPWMVAAVMAGLVVLAAIICAILWHFTHLEKDGEDDAFQSSIAASAENSASDSAGLDEASGTVPDDGAASGTTLLPEDASGSAAPSVPPASSGATASSAPSESTAPSASGTAASPAPTVSPSGTQASTTVQEPISGTTAMEFTQSNADVTPKDVINLRSEPSTLNADNIVAQAKNGEILSRTGVNEATGWTRLDYNGETLYAVSQYLTTDLTYKTPVQASDPNRVNTMDGRIILFTDCSDNITPKEYVNLRTEPSTSEGETTVRCQVSNAEVVHRTGYSPDAGWSRVEYNGEVLYVVSSYVYTVE